MNHQIIKTDLSPNHEWMVMEYEPLVQMYWSHGIFGNEQDARKEIDKLRLLSNKSVVWRLVKKTINFELAI
jgi:hypothetical protein